MASIGGTTRIVQVTRDGRQVSSAVVGYEPIETASLDEVRGLQLERMQHTLRHAYANVAHYRSAFDELGVGPGDLKNLDDLGQFPFLTKEDLRRAYPFDMFAVPRQQVVRVHASSGTTGQPTVVGYTKGDIDTWSTVMARSIFAAGGRPGDIAHVAYGYGLFTGGLGAHYGAERLGCTVVPMSGGQTEKQVRLIRDFAPRIILVTPSYCLSLIEEMERQGLDPASSSLQIGIFGAEPWSEALRDEIEGRLDIDAVDIYGLSEVIGPGVAQECVETKDGLTVWEDHFYPEIIDPDTLEVLPEGGFGELVLTSLTKEALPVIRYRTRDLTRLLPGTARTMRRIARVSGRSDDMLIIRGVNVFPSQVEVEILRVAGLSPYFELVVREEGMVRSLEVRVEQAADALAGRTELQEELGRRVKDNVGLTVDIEIVDAGALPRSQGKAQRVRFET